VLGREFALDALQTLSDLPEDEFFDVLDEALTARVLTSVPGVRDRLRFAHALIRETLYDALTTPRRVQLHRRAGQTLELLYASDPEPHYAELAHHFFEGAAAGDVGPAFAYAQRSGESAARQLAYEEAARFYRLALQALDLTQPVSPATRCDLLLKVGEALSQAGDTPEAKKTFLAAAELARTAGLREHLANAALGYGGRFPWLRAGTDLQLVPLLDEALAALGDEESILRVRLLARLAGALRDQPSLEPRWSISRTAVDIARRLGDDRTLSYALVSLGTATWTPDVTELNLKIADEVSKLAERTDDRERALQACWLHYIPALTIGDLDRCNAVAARYQRLADEFKQPPQLWYGLVLRSHLAQFRGEFEEAEKFAEEALRLGERAQNWDAGFSYRIALFGLRREQGRLGEIEDLLRRSVDEYPGYRSFRCLLALLEWELGREDAARDAFAELSAAHFQVLPRDNELLFCLCVLGEVAAYLGEEAGALTLYDLLLPYWALNAVCAGELAIGSVARYLGLLAATNSRWDEAEQHFEYALEMNARMDARPSLAHTQDDFARMLLTRDGPGDVEKAHALLSEALTTYDELGMRAAAERASAVTGAHAHVGGP
jgi:tetratricopeptide (TPR) repeat protein